MPVSRKSFLASTSALSLSALLAACGSKKSDGGGASGSSADGAPGTITHAFGTTELPTSVERIATVNWANQDVPLALGVMPVGIAKQVFGVEDGSGMLPWTKTKVDELVAGGATAPVLFDETDGIAFEAIADTKPDIILGAYSGMTQEDYNRLSEIAPTIAYPKAAWVTPWREMITMDATAIGKKTEGEALITALESSISAETAKHPQLAGKTAAFFYMGAGDQSSIGFYTTGDPRTAFMEDLGLTIPESVRKQAEADPSTFSYNLSAENADMVNDVDIMVMYGTAEDLPTLQADSLIGTIPAVKNGAIAFVGNGSALSASTNPGPLSLPWGLADYVALIAAAADKVQ
ncbi:iron-siderophore ABC transporter substrate-binding protein [Actinomyces gaoshouyii]|uniref:Periplasmic binding protein n=1 Tax=Actinomyces gaoshouyii TaxID=1960083 RepID=A0A8H9H6Q9_9ACTO|nr:iron-siderophore ABC transporter substrate-binding protein [Actinomyces gaoshouyii]GGO95128.1 periplasmic binding protein [Actinomyces gaoshouyii]